MAERFGLLAAFYERVIERYTEKDPDGLDRKQIGRWIFGDNRPLQRLRIFVQAKRSLPSGQSKYIDKT